MMAKSVGRWIVGLSLVLCAVGPAHATVVNFDDLPGSALVPSPYGGINWDDNWSYYGAPQDPYNPQSQPNRIYSNYQKFAGGAPADIPFYFPTAAVFAGAYVSGLGSETTVTFGLYYLGTLVASTSPFIPSNVATFVGSGYGGLVDKVVVSGDAGYYVLDDVTYDAAAPVPEPGTLLLLGSGLAGLVVRRRRAS